MRVEKSVESGEAGVTLDVEAVLFDVNGTLVEILTEDGMEQIFRAAGHFLTYQGIDLRRHEVRDLYFAGIGEQQRSSPEEHPEFDAAQVWRTIIVNHSTEFTDALPPAKLEWMPLFLAEMSRGISRRCLRPYPHVQDMLDELSSCYPLALVTDAQSAWARAELHRTGLLHYFDPIVISGDHGFRKPDPRLFRIALDALRVAPEKALYVGNDMHRDIFGAQSIGMQTVLFDSGQGTKIHPGAQPDHTITDHRDLLKLLSPA